MSKPESWIVLAVVLTSYGCSSAPEEVEMELHVDCARNACEARIAECEAEASARCDDCYTTCTSIMFSSFDTSCLSSCDRICTSHCTYTCYGDEESTCLSKKFEFTQPERDDAIATACEAFTENAVSCGYEVDAAACETFARVERPAVAQAYSCLALADCSDLEESTCIEHLGTSDLGGEACDVLESVCDVECDAQWEAFVDSEGAWVRTDVAEAVRHCFQETECDALAACLDAWVAAVSQPPQG